MARKTKTSEGAARAERYPTLQVLASRELSAALARFTADVREKSGASLSASAVVRALLGELFRRWENDKLDLSRIHSEADLADLFAGRK